MKVLVTGCNGFAGRHVMDVLRATGHEAVGSDVDGRSHIGVGSVLVGGMTVAGTD